MRRSAKVTGVLIPVLIQDPSVASAERDARSLVHPVVVKDDHGFTAGPACRRVAIVDFDFHSGKLGTPVPLDPKGSPYAGIGSYKADIPYRRGVRVTTWSRSKVKRDVAALGSLGAEDEDAFLKVSVFGTVLRILGLIQDPAVLGREIRWAFPGDQLLVVPRAGELDNAFYHRGSRSLQFYYGKTGDDRAVFSGFSQDIVAHEATHAVIDGIAPSLHDAISAESLAIHEGLADITAALLTMRNRELVENPESKASLAKMMGSSRFSRIAEEFGRWRGYGDALRDVFNAKTLDPRGKRNCRVDGSSPHSLSEVLSGLLFTMFRNVFTSAPDDPALWKRLYKGESAKPETLRLRTSFAGNRVLSLAFRGLDWLPPGEASFGDLIAAMLAADRLFLPQQDLARRIVMKEAQKRHIVITPETETPRDLGPGAFEKLRRSARARAEFALTFGKQLEIPDDARLSVRARTFHSYEPPFVPRAGEVFLLNPEIKPEWRAPENEHLLVKLSWHEREPNEIASWGKFRRYRTGATVVLDRKGRIQFVLRNAGSLLQTRRRSDLLARLLADDSGALGERMGPDGRPLLGAVHTALEGDTLSISGAVHLLHVAGDPP
jgi:hypothetical protein